MEAATKTEWRIAGEEVVSCNCDWGCPCQFNANPTTGNCEALVAWEVREGQFGDTSLDGTRFAQVVWWPGPIHEGDGTRQIVIDEGANPEQREALDAMIRGQHGGAYFEVFASVCPHTREDTIYAPIEVQSDRKSRHASIKIEGVGETQIEPIKNPVTGDEHRARIDLPNGFEYKVAEMANTVRTKTTTDDPLSLTFETSYAQLNEFDWANDG